MCRNIRQLHNFEPPASSEEVHDASLQYVRKISGSNKPSQANAEVFDRAVAEVAAATQRLLDPKVLTRLSNIELVARTVVDGFLTGLHRSPFFGFSLEFAEYRPYTPGDDPRFIDWNVFSRTERTYLKRFLGETNTGLILLLDASASMGFSSNGVSKMEYAKMLAASLAGLRCVIYIPKDYHTKRTSEMTAVGAEIVREADDYESAVAAYLRGGEAPGPSPRP